MEQRLIPKEPVLVDYRFGPISKDVTNLLVRAGKAQPSNVRPGFISSEESIGTRTTLRFDTDVPFWMKLYGDPTKNGWLKAACADSRVLEVWEEVRSDPDLSEYLMVPYRATEAPLNLKKAILRGLIRVFDPQGVRLFSYYIDISEPNSSAEVVELEPNIEFNPPSVILRH